MKIKQLSLDNFMLFEAMDIKWSQNINIISGENSTGKTTLLKIMYSVLKSCNKRSSNTLTKDQIEDIFVSKMIGVFRPDENKIGRLVSRKQGSNKTKIITKFEKNESILIEFGNKQERHADIEISKNLDLKSSEPVYLPPKEMISTTRHFQSLYESYNIDFEEMYYDLTKLLDRPLKRGANSNEQNQVLSSFENILNGNIVRKEDRFYLKVHGSGEFEMGLVSEGYRKLATIIYLILSGSLNKDSVLFWDEPETNMNPKMIKYVVSAIAQLARMGVQVFVTTHDYFVLQGFNFLDKYPENGLKKLDMQYVSLYKENNSILYESSSNLNELTHNVIMDEFDDLYNRELDKLYDN